MAAGGERRGYTGAQADRMTIAMTMKIKFDPAIVLAFHTCCAQPAASQAQACPAACDGDWNHALRVAARCLLPAPDELDAA